MKHDEIFIFCREMIFLALWFYVFVYWWDCQENAGPACILWVIWGLYTLVRVFLFKEAMNSFLILK